MSVQVARGTQAVRRILLDLLFPPRCVCCRRVGEWFCVQCRAGIERIPPPVCDCCGRPWPRPECPYCEKFPLRIDGIRAMAFFEGNLRHAIHCFKYRGRPGLAPVLGGMLSDYFSGQRLPADAVVAVPLHRERERARGYNQSLLLARAFAVAQGLPIWEDVLIRSRATAPQIDLDTEARRANVEGAFTASTRVSGARTLLIDDVCTTGATMDACSAALEARGAKSVWGLALARGR